MGDSPEVQNTTTVEAGGVGRTHQRSLVLVAGSGRSGTSLFTGILQRLGFYVPQPEVPADETNPRGFAESLWVVHFHTGLLRTAGVQMSDARPAAWAQTAPINLDRKVQQELRRWLKQQLHESDDLVIKDPRLSWFLPLWRRCVEDVGASPKFVTVLRHPAAVIDSKQRWYGAWQGQVARAAGWLNQMLFTERATRDAPRAFVYYDDLLDDWTREVGRIGTALDLQVLREAPVPAMRSAHEFVDRTLSRSRENWEDARMPAALRAQIDEVWELVSHLAKDDETDTRPLIDRLDKARAAYVELYEEAEAIAHSSISTGRRRMGDLDGRASSRVASLLRRVPTRYRHKVPPRWRTVIVRALNRSPTRR
jgi:hypothetical protein